jgi:hypothetical protein
METCLFVISKDGERGAGVRRAACAGEDARTTAGETPTLQGNRKTAELAALAELAELVRRVMRKGAKGLGLGTKGRRD